MPKVYAQRKSPEQFLKDQLGQKIELKERSIADQVIADDLIVQGSECVGFDCVNNESFGFNTIRLKENNTRLAFDDTSVGAFPANDWELEANATASGGSSHFAINDVTGARTPFKIIAGAPTNSFFMASNGKIGLRTATPVLDLHFNTGDTPAIRLEQNNTSGFTAQTWDMAGNEANFFIRDVTGGSKLPFRIRPGAPTSSVDISSSGKVGIGTASPLATLHVEGFAFVRDSLFVKGSILPGSIVLPSDIKLKRNILDMGSMSKIISSLSPKTFYYKTDEYPNLGFSNTLQYGLIAQEVEKVLPTFVTPTSFPGEKGTFKTVNYVGLIPVLLQGLKEQIAVNEQQKAEIEDLKAKLAQYEALNTRLDRLEAVLNKEAILSKEEKEKKAEKK
ncbi:tail fiber domain-containing protein [Emticicia sp. BO119]|uniref:tail fiber domain-containing protein n=1 Tax=Emticicia sp. BO119 TaxID=2757768 RepID=UPI0015F04A96|nr:tail fiber domain-containing protein [Emticicia sp. BO119]MBA4852702.1 tail fiber domain-containing protein [Emticicia sp. BO119]